MIFTIPHALFEETKEEKENEEIVQKVLLKSVKTILKNIIEYKVYFMKQSKNLIKNENGSKSNKSMEEPLEIDPKKTLSKIAIMFSGGLDSTLIAHMVNLILPIHETFVIFNF